jgi:hypothetical protein
MRVTVEVPTVLIQVSVPEHTSVKAWQWRGVDTMEVREFVYTGDELQSVFIAYGAVVGVILRGSMWHPTFRLTAHGLFTGRFLGEYHLTWSAVGRMFTPRDRPTVLWPEFSELPDEVRRGAIVHSGMPRLRAVG